MERLAEIPGTLHSRDALDLILPVCPPLSLRRRSQGAGRFVSLLPAAEWREPSDRGEGKKGLLLPLKVPIKSESQPVTPATPPARRSAASLKDVFHGSHAEAS